MGKKYRLLQLSYVTEQPYVIEPDVSIQEGRVGVKSKMTLLFDSFVFDTSGNFPHTSSGTLVAHVLTTDGKFVLVGRE